MAAQVEVVHTSPGHSFSKSPRLTIRLLAGIGVEGDAHAGVTVQHRSRVRRTPQAPNLRQVHLIHGELHDELVAAGYDVGPGRMGENITTRGIDLLGLPTGTLLRVGTDAVIALTGLRNPCVQLDRMQPGLMGAVLDRDDQGELVRKAGVMAVVVKGGDIQPGDPIEIELPAGAAEPLTPV